MLAKIIIAMLCFPLWCGAAFYNAASSSDTDVIAAYSLCQSNTGDIVYIPAGAAGWTQQIDNFKGVSFIGAGTNLTILSNNISDGTAEGFLIRTWLSPARTNTISGIQFARGTRTTVDANGVLRINGNTGGTTNGSRAIVKACFFNDLRGVNIFCRDTFGVISGCSFTNSAANIPVYIYHENFGGIPNSDLSFASPVGWGTDRMLYIESNLFIWGAGVVYAATDAYRGAQYCFRYNTTISGIVEMHGTDSGGRLRGTRAVECYGNTFSNFNAQIVNVRSGALVCWSNRIWYVTNTPLLELSCYRSFYPFTPWGTADGTNAWDGNVDGGPFDSGTATAGTTTAVGSLLTMSDTGKSWTPNQWVGYSIHNMSSNGAYRASYVVSNSSTTITYHDGGGYPALSSRNDLIFGAGNGYQLWRLTNAFDMPGMAFGTQLSGTSPSPIPNDQTPDPCYEWDNYYNGNNNLDFRASQAFIQQNVHYYNDTVKPGYAPLGYPHPLLSTALAGINAGTINAVNMIRR